MIAAPKLHASLLILLQSLAYKSISLAPPSPHDFINKTQAKAAAQHLAKKERVEKQNMVSPKRLAQMAKKWQRMAALGRKRLTQTTTTPKGAAYDECCTTSSMAMKGHCVVYTADGGRFEVPLPYLGTSVFSELLRMSQEVFGFEGGDGGRITLPCDIETMEYAMCLLQKDASTEVMNAFMSSVARPCSFDGCVVVPYVELNQHVAVC
jgi:hypothetical protein